MVAAPINYINVDKRGVAYIAGTKMKVLQVVLETQEWGHTPGRIHEGHPHISLAQIYAALSYYHDHQEQIDAEIAQLGREYDTERAQEPRPLTRQELEARLRSKTVE